MRGLGVLVIKTQVGVVGSTASMKKCCPTIPTDKIERHTRSVHREMHRPQGSRISLKLDTASFKVGHGVNEPEANTKESLGCGEIPEGQSGSTKSVTCA